MNVTTTIQDKTTKIKRSKVRKTAHVLRKYLSQYKSEKEEEKSSWRYTSTRLVYLGQIRFLDEKAGLKDSRQALIMAA